MEFVLSIFKEAWALLLESSIYIIFGILIGGILKIFLNPESISRHLGEGRFRSVFKAAIMGIPLPLCSCGVLPAAISLKKQGANKGATTAFLISTPESGVDSIAVTYALLDPIMTVMRPVAAFIMAAVAGITENVLNPIQKFVRSEPDLSCPVDKCCDGVDCEPDVHRRHHTFLEKVVSGIKFAFSDVWGDIAVWFFAGLLLAGLITVLIPEDVAVLYLGGGILSMLIMLAMGVPLYVCATASTPIAAALIMKGVSPGAALVFLLAGPATNITSLTVLIGVLGKRATAIYLATISIFSVVFGLMVDRIYTAFDLAPQAIIGHASEMFPVHVQLAGAVFLLVISIRPVLSYFESWRLRSRAIIDRRSNNKNSDIIFEKETVCKTPT